MELVNKLINLYQRNKIFFIFLFFILLIIINIILSKPEKKVETKSWNIFTIGKKTSFETLNSLNPLETETKDGETIYKYQSDFKSFPNEVVVNKNSEVEFIKEFIIANENHTIDQYLNELGEYDLELMVPQISESLRADVFLNDGLAVIFHVSNKKVVQKWYFTPTDKDTFLQTWGNELSEKFEQHF